MWTNAFLIFFLKEQEGLGLSPKTILFMENIFFRYTTIKYYILLKTQGGGGALGGQLRSPEERGDNLCKRGKYFLSPSLHICTQTCYFFSIFVSNFWQCKKIDLFTIYVSGHGWPFDRNNLAHFSRPGIMRSGWFWLKCRLLVLGMTKLIST